MYHRCCLLLENAPVHTATGLQAFLQLSKLGNTSKQTYFDDRHKNSQQAHGKMFTINNHH